MASQPTCSARTPRQDDLSRSDLSSSPSLTSSSTSSQSNPRTPQTPRTPARYPSNLSLGNRQLRPNRPNVSPKSGKPYEYQSLEDLLRSNGYRETRIFTPESERTPVAEKGPGLHHHTKESSPLPPRRNIRSGDILDAQGGVGGVVASLLSSWRHGSGQPSSQHKNDVPAAPDSRSSSPSLGPAFQPTARLAVSFDPPSHLRGTRGRGSPVPRTALTNALESALKKAQSNGTQSRSPSTMSPPNASSMRPRFASAASPIDGLTPSSSSSTIRPSSSQRLRDLHPATVTTTEVRVDPVLCRSAPSSRSASRVGQKRSRSGGKKDTGKGKAVQQQLKPHDPLGTPLLSPSVDSALWDGDLDRAAEEDTDSGGGDSDADPPNLEAILSTYLKHSTRRGENQNSFVSLSESDSDEPVARRQRSIRSLRAHLAHSNGSNPHIATPGVNGVPALPAFPIQFKSAKTLTVHSATTTPSPASSDLNGWLGERGSRGSGRKVRGKVATLWLSPKAEEPEEGEEESGRRGRR
ncbi:hypothetical protein FRB99_008988, partial [Tulasnella sp. 403]